MSNVTQVAVTALLGISAYLFPSQVVRLRSVLLYTLGHILFNFVKTSKQPELLGNGRLRQVLEECSSVLTKTYYPTPWCVGPHLQSIVRVFMQSIPRIRLEREYVPTPDGGQFAIDWLVTQGPDDLDRPILMIVPGITGGSHVNYVRQLMLNGQNHNCRCVVFNNRGCAFSTLLTPRTYSGSNTDDITLAVDLITERYPRAPIVIVAVSLGGMITTHYLASPASGDSNVKAACIISSPWNAFATSESVNAPINHLLYERFLLKKLKMVLEKNKHLYQNSKVPINFRHVMKAETLREFDDRFTAKMFGWADWKEYYAKGHSFDKLPHVDVPTLIINAEDDPLSPPDYLPFNEVDENPNLAMVLTKTGGHIGFLEGVLPHGQTWLNRAVEDFLQVMIFTDFLSKGSPKNVPIDYY